MRYRKLSLSKIFLLSLISIIIVSILATGHFLVSRLYKNFRKESETLRQNYLESQKELLKLETNQVIDYINYRRLKADEQLKLEVKQNVYEAHSIVSNLYNEYRDKKTNKEIQKLIKDALRPVRFINGRGHFLIYSMDGTELLNPASPQTEGTNRLDLRDKNGVYVIRKEIEIVKKEGEGFSINYYNGPNDEKIFSKASFVKHFAPYDWYIGTIEYREDFIEDVQHDVLARVRKIRFGKDGYIFIITFDGLMLLNEAQKELEGRNISRGHGEKVARILREARILVSKPEGGFFTYTWRKPSTQKDELKMSYFKGVPDWQWIVGAGIYLDEIDDIISEKRNALVRNVKHQVTQIVIIFLIIIALVVVLTLLFTRRLNKELAVFQNFFSDSAFKDRVIDRDKLLVLEFKKLADSANEMLSRRQAAESLLQESEERLAVTFRSIAEGVITTDINGKIVLINRIAEQLTGWKQEEALGRNLNEVYHVVYERYREPVRKSDDEKITIGSKKAFESDTILVSKDGAERVIAENVALIRNKESIIIGSVVVFRDVTESQQMEREAQRTQKLESLGLLAGGIAHDFNNLLTSILGNISLVKMYIDRESKDKIKRSISRTEDAVIRTKNLTQQLLTFAKGGTPVKEILNVSSVLNESISISLRGSNVKCEADIPENLWTIEADEGQMSQVFNNLIINARQAMPDGGTIRISVENVFLDHAVTSYYPIEGEDSRINRNYVKITIQDFGVGISKENLQKIFDPYFTTKEKGTGLGLASTYSIILKHKGFLTVDSRVDEGSVFCIYLPASGQKAMKKDVEIDAAIPGKGRILVLDDEKPLLALVEDMLIFLGYEAETVSDGQSAIDRYEKARKEGNSFDAVIVDLTIPGSMGGEETIRRLLRLDPEIKAIVSSGYSNSPVMGDFAAFGFKARIAKPYRIEELSQILHDVLKE